ncbi:PQ-loop domain-containing transporter [Mycoplasma sp. 1012]
MIKFHKVKTLKLERHNLMTEIFGEIFGWFGVIFTVAFAVPQLIKTFKEKSGKVNLLSFFIFFFGVTLWSIYASLLEFKKIQLVVANLLSLVLLTITINLFLKYRESKFYKPFIFLSTIYNIGVICFASIAYHNGWKLNSIADAIFGIAAASGTSFAFAPQTFMIIKTRNVKDLSLITLILGFLINFSWEIYWFIIGFSTGLITKVDIIYILIVQAIAMIIYTIQIVLLLKEKSTKIKHK